MRLFFSFLVLLISIPALSQENPVSNYTIMTVDEAPVIEDCVQTQDSKECFRTTLKDHIMQEVNASKSAELEGRVYVSFLISDNAEIHNITAKAKEEELAEEAEKAVRKLKIAKPALLDGKAVAVAHVVPVTFRSNIFNSYADFFENKAAGKKEVENAAIPPLYKSCIPSSQKTECFIETTEKIVRSQITNSDFDGSRIYYYFEISKDGEVENAMALSRDSNDARLKVQDLLKNLELAAPAKDENKKPISTYFQGELVL